jgi:pimeloyl-ACP methyl ester carboxylesterase
MKSRTLTLFAAMTLFTLAPSQVRADAVRDCGRLQSTNFAPPGDAVTLTIDSATLVAAADGLPQYCEVVGHIDRGRVLYTSGSPYEGIGFKVKLPAASSWNRKLLMSGGFNSAGSFDDVGPDLSFGLGRGYATVATDAGHDGEDLVNLYNRADGSAVSAEKLRNNAHRGVHLTALSAGTLIWAFYGRPAVHSYFEGCSRGGIQAMMAAGTYPDDFDGVVAISPGVLTGLGHEDRVWNSRAMFPGGPSDQVLPDAKVPLLASAVLAKCDALDGMVDGVVDDPRACAFSPSKDLPACPKDIDGPLCFTNRERAALEKVHQGATRNGLRFTSNYIFAGNEDFFGFDWFISGHEQIADGGGPDAFGPGMPTYEYTQQVSMRFAYNDAAYLLQNFDFNSASASVFLDVIRIQYPRNPDLSAFAKRDGKLIIQHGWSDTIMPSNATIDYYEQMAAAMGGMSPLKKSARLFMSPGGDHCGGGLGPFISIFGYGVGGGGDSHLAALEDWVEQGKAPNAIIAANPGYLSSLTSVSRPICAYPTIAKLIRPSLDPNVASSFHCVHAQSDDGGEGDDGQ